MLRSKQLKTLLACVLVLVFIALHIYTTLIGKPYAPVLPIAALVGLTAFYKPNWLIYLVVFSAPLSFNFEDLGEAGVGFYFPTEPLFIFPE